MNRIGIQKIVNLKTERPVILFVVSFKGSLYGNHFVMVYKYVEYNGYYGLKHMIIRVAIKSRMD